MKMWPPHPNTTTNKKIICSKSYYSVSEVSSNMSAISRIFYGGLGVNSGSEIVFLVKKCPELRYTDKYPLPWLVKRPIWRHYTEKSRFLGFFFNFFKIFSKTFYVRISMFWHFLRVFDMNFDEKPPSNHLRTIVEWIGEFLKNPNFLCVVTTQSDYFLDSDFWKSDQILTLLNKYND